MQTSGIDRIGPTAAETDLVQRAQGGELGAFETLYRDHVGRVFAICRRMTGDHTRAEELTQETFLRAWTRLRTFRPGHPLRPWLGKVAVNVVLSDRRSRARREGKEDLREDFSTFGDTPAALHAGGGVDLERAIALLPPRARATFVLHDVEGYRHDEVADLLGVTVGTCKAQLHRARKMLREALQP